MLVGKGLGGVFGGLQGWCEKNVDLRFGSYACYSSL